jgi:hypothetical protein
MVIRSSIIPYVNKIKKLKYILFYSDTFATFINIATKSGKTKACINATNNSCIYIISGIITGNSIFIRLRLSADTAHTSIANNIPPEVTLPNNLNEREISFARCHTISSTHKNNEIIISKILMMRKRG